MKNQCQYLFDSTGGKIDPSLTEFPNFGDGVFETALAVHGELPFWNFHRARLEKGLSRLHIPLAQNIIDRCLGAVFKVESSLSHGYFKLKLQVFRGTSLQYLGYSCNDAKPLIKIDFESVVEPRFDSIDLACSTVKLASQPILAGLKHMNRLEQVLARKEIDAINMANENTFSEALIFDQGGCLVEAIASNVFLRVDDQWRTPLLDRCGVEGTTRGWLIEYAFQKLGQAVRVETVTHEALARSDAMFICNSIAGVREVNSLVLENNIDKNDAKICFSQSDEIKAIADYWLSAVGVKC